MNITTEGYHLIEVPAVSTEAVINVQGTLGSGSAKLYFKVEEVYVPLIGGQIVPYVYNYTLAQKYTHPLYIGITGSDVSLTVSVSERAIGSPMELPFALKALVRTVYYLTGVQIGQAIITPEDVWTDEQGTEVYDLLQADGSEVDEVTHPVLWGKLPLEDIVAVAKYPFQDMTANSSLKTAQAGEGFSSISDGDGTFSPAGITLAPGSSSTYTLPTAIQGRGSFYVTSNCAVSQANAEVFGLVRTGGSNLQQNTCLQVSLETTFTRHQGVAEDLVSAQLMSLPIVPADSKVLEWLVTWDNTTETVHTWLVIDGVMQDASVSMWLAPVEKIVLHWSWYGLQHAPTTFSNMAVFDRVVAIEDIWDIQGAAYVPDLPTAAGSPFPYKIVADLTGGNL